MTCRGEQIRRRRFEKLCSGLLLISLAISSIVRVAPVCGQTLTRSPILLGGTQPGMPSYPMICTNTFQQLDFGTPNRGSFAGSPNASKAASGSDNSTNSSIRSKPLRDSTPVSVGLRSGAYVSRVGGVAFDQVAQPDTGLEIDNVALEYDATTHSDGERVSVLASGRRYRLELPDWQLVPIAEFADSSYNAVVTLFGELDGDRQKPATHYVVAYHPAFEATLLGLRVFQGDFLLLDPNVAGELPRIRAGYILGIGETQPTHRVWRPAAAALSRRLAETPFSSYVISDFKQTPRFSLDHQRQVLRMTGSPYFFFWDRGPTQYETLVADGGRRVRFKGFKVTYLDGLSDDISEDRRNLFYANPAVYSCLQKTLRYSAFFRYCKRSNRAMWQKFLVSIRQIPEKHYRAPTPVLHPKKPAK
jgi:hypothetical protein